jgi:hypothetical protein
MLHDILLKISSSHNVYVNVTWFIEDDNTSSHNVYVNVTDWLLSSFHNVYMNVTLI